MTVSTLLRTACGGLLASRLLAADTAGDRMLAEYFRFETAALHAQTFAGVKTLQDWTSQRETLRGQLREMLGLAPLPERTPLHATIVGREEQPEFFVEKLHFQSLPGLYVTANLYVPKQLAGKVPAILYISGHSRVREGNISFGSKATYQHHGAWFARHGFVCLTVDSIGELAEIEGMHHGTHSGTRWWWNSRGYTPAGTETWNAMRAIDYLETRPEVDAKRIGVTGRSGGGVGTWWIAALDDRVKVAVPVAGMTDLQNQVVDGKVSRHCDCMFMVNTYRWDFAKIAALIAPRPLMFANSDKDDIFPLDGVERLHRELTDIYRLYGASDKLALLITDGPHKDTQDLQVPAFRWMHRFLAGKEIVVERAATKFFTPAQLKVFATLPSDQRNTRIDEEFVPAAKPSVPRTAAEWESRNATWQKALAEKVFAGWPARPPSLDVQAMATRSDNGIEIARWEFTSQQAVRLPLFILSRAGAAQPPELHLAVLDDSGWRALAPMLEPKTDTAAAAARPELPESFRRLHERVVRGEVTLAYFPPRGIGPTAWTATDNEQIHLRRRFMLLGQTLEGMRVWDIRRALEALAQPGKFAGRSVQLTASGSQATNALYASLFAPNVAGLALDGPAPTHMTAPDYLSVLRYLDVPQAAAMAAARTPVRLTGVTPDAWTWTATAVQQLGWPGDRFQIAR